jgi:hypothetical protein
MSAILNGVRASFEITWTLCLVKTTQSHKLSSAYAPTLNKGLTISGHTSASEPKYLPLPIIADDCPVATLTDPSTFEGWKESESRNEEVGTIDGYAPESANVGGDREGEYGNMVDDDGMHEGGEDFT